MAVDHALEHVSEVGERFDVIELCRGDEGTDSGPSLCATVGAGKEMIFAPERQFAFILPISGRKPRSTIAGIRITAVNSAVFIVSAVQTVSSSLLSSEPAWLF